MLRRLVVTGKAALLVRMYAARLPSALRHKAQACAFGVHALAVWFSKQRSHNL